MNAKRTKPRIALFAMGVIGGGNLGYGIPVLHDLFLRLAAHYEIVFYSFSTINPSNVPKEIKLRQSRWRLPGRLKFLWMSLKFAVDQIFIPSKLIFAISIYPTSYWAIRMGRIFNRPVCVQIIALEAVSLPDIVSGNLMVPWLRKITVEVCKKADRLIAVADYQKVMAQKCLPTNREIDVLPLRIDYRKFFFKERKISFPVEFIHIAYYSPIKDQDSMFHAFAKVSQSIDCHLTVIGHGYNIPEVHSMMNALQISDKVTFTGEIDQSDIPNHFHKAHILLHPARFETGCAVIQEAMASGVAVCGTRVGILADIGDGYAMISPANDPDGLAKNIIRLIEDRDLYDTITTKAYQWIQTYDSIWSYKNYQRFIDDVLNQRSR
jgi:glycosyltransferase involved in cell wall biosynthesis